MTSFASCGYVAIFSFAVMSKVSIFLMPYVHMIRADSQYLAAQRALF